MKKIFLIVFLCSINILFSQIKFDGIVKDSIGNPLELANIIVLDQKTNTLDSYSITDEKGYYSFELEKNTNYKFQVSYIGMNSFEEIISTKEFNITRDFLLQADNALDEVELTYEMPVTIKGDTIVYNADSFKNGSERKLEDVLEKLVERKLTCFYCSKQLFVLYKNVREPLQWTLDRIDNDLNHSKENTCISCLKCNLQRRVTDSGKFIFTKKLKINKV